MAITPIWQGPEKDGITQSLLGRFLSCRERFRLLVVHGLKPVDTFRHALEYGQMWHACEEAHADGADWAEALQEYCQPLARQYPTQQEQVQHWYRVCKTQFPIYVKYWAKHPDVKNREPLVQEQTFNIPYELPSGRTVRLRGKWDSVDVIGKGSRAKVYLQENKTKGDVDEEQLKQQLQFDLQTMLYLTAMHMAGDPTQAWPHSIAGVRYNVVRRPLSGGRHSIRQHKPTKSKPQGESQDEYYNRLGGLIASDQDFFFMRWKAVVTDADVETFKQQFLNPVLEQLCQWWDHITTNLEDPFQPSNTTHYRYPFGVYNPVGVGRASELDEYLSTGSTLGLQETDTVFPEL